MKKNVFNFILCFCLLILCMMWLVGCDSEKTEEKHTHSFPIVYSSDATHHWKQCEICDEIRAKTEHTSVNGICSVCSYVVKNTEPKRYIVSYSHRFITYGNLGNEWGFGIKNRFDNSLLQDNEVYLQFSIRTINHRNCC